MLRLDYLSCVLTIASTILVGRRCWEGWALAGVNSVLICVIGLRTAQLGFIPANVFCMVMSAINLHAWRKPERHRTSADRGPTSRSLGDQQILRKGPLLVNPLCLAAESGVARRLHILLAPIFVTAFRPDGFSLGKLNIHIRFWNAHDLPPLRSQMHLDASRLVDSSWPSGQIRA